MSIVVPSSPKDQKKVKDSINEIVNSLLRMDSERDNIKAICEVLKDELELNPALVKKTARIIHTAKKQEFDETMDDLDALYNIATMQ